MTNPNKTPGLREAVIRLVGNLDADGVMDDLDGYTREAFADVKTALATQSPVPTDDDRINPDFGMQTPVDDVGQSEEPPPADVCPYDGRQCFVEGDEPHWRCGTSACDQSPAPAVGDAVAKPEGVEEAVEAIADIAAERRRQADLMRRFDLSRSTVQAVIARRVWRHAWAAFDEASATRRGWA